MSLLPTPLVPAGLLSTAREPTQSGGLDGRRMHTQKKYIRLPAAKLRLATNPKAGVNTDLAAAYRQARYLAVEYVP